MSEENENYNEESVTETQEDKTTQEDETTQEVDETTDVNDSKEDVDEPQDEHDSDEGNGEQLTQEEFNKLYFQLKQQERENEELRKKALGVNENNTSNNTNNQQVTEQPKTLEDFDYDEESYHNYLVEQKVNDILSKKEREQSQKAVIQTFEQRAEEYNKQNPEYSKAVENYAQYVKYTPQVQEAILSSDAGPALDHYLLTNPQVVDKINNMSPTSALMELGRLETKLSANNSVQKRTVSKAPDPIPTTGNGSKATINPEKLSAEEYYKKYFGD